MRSLREKIEEYKRLGRAIGHFNISDSNQLHAIANAARETKLPVLVGLSEGERDFFPIAHARAIIEEYKKEGLEMYLNADHTYSLPKAIAAIDAGVDSIVVDGAKLPFEENVRLVAAVVVYSHQRDFFGLRKHVLVEGELGYIGQSSQVLDALPQGVAVTEETMTKPEELQKFITETGADLMAPAVGNVHGVIASGNPKLSINRITALVSASSVPLVLHGGSGSSDEEFIEAVKAGMPVIHINTDLRPAYRHGIERGLQEKPHEVAPYKFLGPAVEDMTAFLVQKMRLFARVK